jgi:AP2-associated kinase
MLREHGTQRPTVFELLTHVHRLRGTKSKFSYNIPVASPLLPRPQFKSSSSSNSLNNVITYTSPPAKSAPSLYDPSSRQSQPPVNQGIQARDRVLEAIAPMRRGRPDGSRESKNASSSRPPSPQKTSAPKQSSPDKSKNWLDNDFGPEQDRAWKAATEHTLAGSSHSMELGWSIGDVQKPGDGQKPQKEKLEQSTGFGDNFQNVWNSFDSNLSAPVPPRLSPRPNLATPIAKPIRPLAHTGGVSRMNQNALPSKDAFDGLGLMTTTSRPAPTMGEARKLRTGLAIVNTPIIPSDYKRHDNSKISSSSRRPSLSPRLNYLSTTSSHSKAISPTPTSSTSNFSLPKLPSLPVSGSIASTSRITNGFSTESRFPSLEELDARLVPSANLLYPSSVNDASRNFSHLTKIESQLPSSANSIGSSGTGGNFLKPSIILNTSHSVSGVRSEQVTGVAMRESKQSRRPESDYLSSKLPPSDPEYSLLSTSPRDSSRSVQKPNLDSSKGVESTPYAKIIDLEPPQLPSRPSHSATPRDWLTGDDDHGDIRDVTTSTSSEVPVLRGSPSKRASYIEPDKFELATAQHVIVHDQAFQEPLSADLSPTVSKFKRTFPALETIDTESLHPTDVSDLVDDRSSTTTKDTEEDSSSADEGPEDPRRLRSADLKKPSRARGRQSSVHDLVYKYGGRVTQKDKDERERERIVQHSVGDYVPQRSKVRPLEGLVPPTKSHVDHKTPSPTLKPLASPTRRSPQHHQFSTQANKSQSQASKPPTPGRSRPQSMFIFPSKSMDSSPILSPGLVPPEEPVRRAVRRTSISDIVERYEAIGGKTKLGGPLSPLPKSMTTRTTSIPTEPRRIQKPSISTSSRNVLSSSQSILLSKTSMSSDSSHSNIGGDPFKTQLVSKEPLRQATGSPAKPRKSLALEKGELIHTQLVDDTTPRPRRISRKAEPFEQVVSQPAKAPSEVEIFTPTNSPRKSTLFGTDLLSQKSEDRSSSPERPYQGVGRLIDQWQKKSAEADSQSTFAGKRGGFVAKRVGIVHGDDERSQ